MGKGFGHPSFCFVLLYEPSEWKVHDVQFDLMMVSFVLLFSSLGCLFYGVCCVVVANVVIARQAGRKAKN